jgi:hypothetical protein
VAALKSILGRSIRFVANRVVNAMVANVRVRGD